MRRTREMTAIAGVIAGALLASQALAGPEKGKAPGNESAQHSAQQNKAEKGKAKTASAKTNEKAEAKAKGHGEDEAQGKAKGHDEDKAQGKAKGHDEDAPGKDEADEKGRKMPPFLSNPGAETAQGRHGVLRQFFAWAKKGKLSKDDIKEQLQALKDSRKERLQARREAIRDRWGDRLSSPAAIQELRHHAQRSAKLNRMLELAHTERDGEASDKLIERIEKLMDKEDARHEKKMESLSAQPPGKGAEKGGHDQAAPEAKGLADKKEGE